MRRARVDLRVREEEKSDWTEAADKKGVTLSELVRQQMLPYTSRSTRKLVQKRKDLKDVVLQSD